MTALAIIAACAISIAIAEIAARRAPYGHQYATSYHAGRASAGEGVFNHNGANNP